MSVRNYHYSLRDSPEERSSHLLRGGSLKSRTDKVGGPVKLHVVCTLCVIYREGSSSVKLKYGEPRVAET